MKYWPNMTGYQLSLVHLTSPSLLHDNVAPSPLQTTQLKTSLEGLETPLADIESDLDLLRNAVVSLGARSLRLQSLKNDYETALSPIRRVPSEIMMEILRRSWKDNEYGGISSRRRLAGFNVFTIREGPWHLGQVCSSWRNVIKTLCPELWASMTIEIPFSPNLNARVPLKAHAVEILRVVLERSCNHPLDFNFTCYGPVSHSEVEEGESQPMKQCFDIMTAQSRRWRAVEMTIHPSYIPRLSLIRGKLDLLRDMYFGCCRDPPSRDVRAFEIAPKLENSASERHAQRGQHTFPCIQSCIFLRRKTIRRRPADPDVSRRREISSKTPFIFVQRPWCSKLKHTSCSRPSESCYGFISRSTFGVLRQVFCAAWYYRR